MADFEYMANSDDIVSLSEYDDTDVNVAGNESDDGDESSEVLG